MAIDLTLSSDFPIVVPANTGHRQQESPSDRSAAWVPPLAFVTIAQCARRP